jgi:hypothetical protein
VRAQLVVASLTKHFFDLSAQPDSIAAFLFDFPQRIDGTVQQPAVVTNVDPPQSAPGKEQE